MKFLTLTVFAILIAAVCCIELDPRCPINESSESKVTYLQHETDCDKYYMCSNGISYMFECPRIAESENRLHWDKVEESCNWPEVAKCDL